MIYCQCSGSVIYFEFGLNACIFCFIANKYREDSERRRILPEIQKSLKGYNRYERSDPAVPDTPVFP